MRLIRVPLVILGIGIAAYAVWILSEPPNPIRDQRRGADFSAPRLRPIPVVLNHGSEVPSGFRGDVHPLLRGQTRLELNAYWAPIGEGSARAVLENPIHKLVYSWFQELRPAQARQTYTEREFSAFLPEVVEGVGQLWALDAARVAAFLKQFHPRPSMNLIAPGRRAGPDGAFAILRAASLSHLDVIFRVHAEFDVAPDGYAPMGIGAYYTPAYFSGRMVVNKQTGKVDHFRLALATDKSLNVHLTVAVPDLDLEGYRQAPHDIVRVERMELTSGAFADDVAWDKELPPAEAQARLARVFYKFQEIDWVPIDQVQAEALRRNRPIFAVVLWGMIDDQSC